jgi:hypothetical protein
MSISFNRRTYTALLIVLGAVLLVVPIGLRAANTPTVLEACVNPGNGNMRLVDTGTACHANETRVEWNSEGPQGPPGPQGDPGAQGPPGPSGSGGPPFVWVCTPAHFPQGGSSSRSDLYVFNGSASTANVAVHFLDKDGNNLVGHTIPGSVPATVYPGESGAATAPVSIGHTRNLTWVMPVVSPPPTFDGITDVVFTVTVTSDQPVVVGANFQFGGFLPNVCHLLPK